MRSKLIIVITSVLLASPAAALTMTVPDGKVPVPTPRPLTTAELAQLSAQDPNMPGVDMITTGTVADGKADQQLMRSDDR